MEDLQITTEVERKQEALERMQILGLDQSIIDAFDKENKLYVASQDSIDPASDEIYEAIENLASMDGSVLPYFVIKTAYDTNEGEIAAYALLIVTQYKDDYEFEKAELPRNLASSIVYMNGMYELGSIGFEKTQNGFVRTF